MLKILQLTTYGTKSIEKPITINFSNATIDKGLKKVNNVKGIYGYNGSGKSAIVEAVSLYKMIAMKPDYLQDSYVKSRLGKLINYKTNEFYVSVIFALGGDIKIFRHEMKVVADPSRERFTIEEESLSKSSKRTINEEFDLIIEKRDRLLHMGKGFSEELPAYLAIESLRYSSIVAESRASLMEKEGESKSDFESYMACFLAFATNLQCCLSDSAQHDYLFLAHGSRGEKLPHYERVSFFDPQRKVVLQGAGQKTLMDKKDFEHFKKENRKLEKFIKIFKPSVESIGLRVEESRDNMTVGRYFAYDGYNVDLGYESSGLKQLVNLFPSLSMCALGSIIFIDEIDENINSVYLEKLISFFKKYGEGQLIFTTHNLETMNILKNQRRAIEVLGDDGEMDVWVQRGNASAKNDYEGGYFPSSPMNVEDFDFINVFQGED